MSASAAHHGNPSPLPPRYEIRQLTSADCTFANAILLHTNMFYSPMWTPIYHGDVAHFWRLLSLGDYLVQHQVDSGLSYGVFDTHYQYKRKESEATGGALYWDHTTVDGVDGQTLLAQMDFPLVSIALSYDQAKPLDMAQMGPLIEGLPAFGHVYHALAAGDKRAPADWSATAPGQVLMRNGTSTRADYEGAGVMKGMAHWLMREAKLKGFRGIQIECVPPSSHSRLDAPATAFHCGAHLVGEHRRVRDGGTGRRQSEPFLTRQSGVHESVCDAVVAEAVSCYS